MRKRQKERRMVGVGGKRGVSKWRRKKREIKKEGKYRQRYRQRQRERRQEKRDRERQRERKKSRDDRDRDRERWWGKKDKRIHYYTSKMKKGTWVKGCRRLLETWTAMGRDSNLRPQKEIWDTFISAQWDLFRLLIWQTIIKLCCFKPLNMQ